MTRFRAFTLMELLVVLAVVALIAGILLPVLGTARSVALRAVCLSHFHQVAQASTLYQTDYDEFFVPVNHQPGEMPNSRVDRTWVQLLLPYVGSFKVFECPADTSNRPKPDATFDQDLIPGDLYSEYYTASMHSNVGYNFQYVAPIYKQNGVWTAQPKSESQIDEPSSMLLFLDSVWEVRNGVPMGGGNWLVSPPCRYEVVNGQQIDTFAAVAARSGDGSRYPTNSPEVFAPTQGWEFDQDSKDPYGGVWPWHLGRATVAIMDGSTRALTIPDILDGCDAKPKWEGTIYDRADYAWSPGQ